MSAVLVAAQKTVEQLRSEAALERVNVSESSRNLLQYCQEKHGEDPLLAGVSPNDNPFKDNKVCTIV